jgi:hypothetical protein
VGGRQASESVLLERASTMAMIPASWPLGVPGVMAAMDAPSRERTATALPPGVPSWSPSINRPEPF